MNNLEVTKEELEKMEMNFDSDEGNKGSDDDDEQFKNPYAMISNAFKKANNDFGEKAQDDRMTVDSTIDGENPLDSPVAVASSPSVEPASDSSPDTTPVESSS